MARVYTHTRRLDADIVDAFCELQKGFTDQFVYFDKGSPTHYLGLGRCIAVSALADIEYTAQGDCEKSPIAFSFQRFDGSNPKPADELFETFPNLRFMVPEIVLIEDETGIYLQVNSLGPVYEGRVNRFATHALRAPVRLRKTVGFTLEPDSKQDWTRAVASALSAIDARRVEKVVLSRRKRLVAKHPFTSADLLVNLIDGTARGTVVMYRYGDVFFIGCTPELLVRKRGENIESMCLAGTTGIGDGSPAGRQRQAEELLHDDKNLREHAFVVDFIRSVVSRNCHSVNIPDFPSILALQHVQHLYTPVKAKAIAGKSIQSIAGQLHPTPALSGTPVGESLMLIREIESFNRGFFGGSVGFVDADGNGEFSVALRSGVFDGEYGWVYAGCGIVAGSAAEDEYDEIDMKLKTILSAFDGGN